MTIEEYARAASIALMRLSGGGSEMFLKIGDEYYADPELCVDRANSRMEHREKYIRAAAEAKTPT